MRLLDGRLRGESSGNGSLVLGLHGLSANHRTLRAVGEAVAAAGRRFVGLDLRARGGSPPTGPGTYGWANHARDVVAVADELGAGTVALVGHSMGAFVAMQAAADFPDRIERVVLVDAAGIPDADAVIPIATGLERLGRSAPSAAAYLKAIRDLGIVSPWSDAWEDAYRYELEPDGEGGVRSRTDRDAVLEDLGWGSDHDPRDLWPRVTCPALLVLASRPLGADGGGILARADFERFGREVPGAELLEVDANHFGVIAHEDTTTAVARFLSH